MSTLSPSERMQRINAARLAKARGQLSPGRRAISQEARRRMSSPTAYRAVSAGGKRSPVPRKSSSGKSARSPTKRGRGRPRGAQPQCKTLGADGKYHTYRVTKSGKRTPVKRANLRQSLSNTPVCPKRTTSPKRKSPKRKSTGKRKPTSPKRKSPKKKTTTKRKTAKKTTTKRKSAKKSTSRRGPGRPRKVGRPKGSSTKRRSPKKTTTKRKSTKRVSHQRQCKTRSSNGTVKTYRVTKTGKRIPVKRSNLRKSLSATKPCPKRKSASPKHKSASPKRKSASPKRKSSAKRKSAKKSTSRRGPGRPRKVGRPKGSSTKRRSPKKTTTKRKTASKSGKNKTNTSMRSCAKSQIQKGMYVVRMGPTGRRSYGKVTKIGERGAIYTKRVSRAKIPKGTRICKLA